MPIRKYNPQPMRKLDEIGRTSWCWSERPRGCWGRLSGTARDRERTAVQDARSKSFASSSPPPRLRRRPLYCDSAMKVK